VLVAGGGRELGGYDGAGPGAAVVRAAEREAACFSSLMVEECHRACEDALLSSQCVTMGHQ